MSDALFREEVLEDALLKSWDPIALDGKKRDSLIAHLTYILEEDTAREGDRAAHLETQIVSVQTRLTRLIDALLDGTLDKESFEMRKRLLLEEEQSLKDSLQSGAPDLVQFQARLTELFELACTAQQSYRLASPESKREMALRLTSNRTVSEKDVSVEPYFPLAFITQYSSIHRSGHQRNSVRTFKNAARAYVDWMRDEVKSGRYDKRQETIQKHLAA